MKDEEAQQMLRIAVPVLAVLAAGYVAAAWSYGFEAHGASQTGSFGSEQAAVRISPIPLRDFPDLITIFTEEN
jgi:hypothetical protein